MPDQVFGFRTLDMTEWHISLDHPANAAATAELILEAKRNPDGLIHRLDSAEKRVELIGHLTVNRRGERGSTDLCLCRELFSTPATVQAAIRALLAAIGAYRQTDQDLMLNLSRVELGLFGVVDERGERLQELIQEIDAERSSAAAIEPEPAIKAAEPTRINLVGTVSFTT